MSSEADMFGNVLTLDPNDTSPRCHACEVPLARHVGGKGCVVGQATVIRSWWDLPMARRAWVDASIGR